MDLPKRKSTAEISAVLNSLAGISSTTQVTEDFGPTWSYTDPGFCADGACASIEPFIEV